MLAEIGIASLVIAFVVALYALIASVVAARREIDTLMNSARNAALLVFPILFVSSLALLVALMRQDYHIAYVWQVSNPATPDFYRFTALWGSQQGSLLFWNLLLSLFIFAAILVNWRRNHRLMPYAIAFMMAVLVFFVGLSVFLENPFARIWILADNTVVNAVFQPEGSIVPQTSRLAETARGLNPLLRHFGMIIHPPMLYLGFVGMTIPFAFAMSALASGDLTTNWIKATRRWILIGWLFLSLGLLLGGRWAYDVLGWGGYWGWDPVENAAFIPWLIGTAFLHSVMIQEKRGMLKVWNMFLVIFTFSTVIFGTFATRSGLIDSVHSFAQSEIGLPMFLFWAGMTIVSVSLIVYRWNRGQLRGEHTFNGILSRETLFVLNNVIFVALALAIFWGSFAAPILSEMFMGVDITLGADYFNPVTAPLFLVMYLLMGVAPLTAWGVMSVRRLGKAMIVPSILTLISMVITAILGAHSPMVILAYGIVLFAGFVALYEIYRGAKARTRGGKETLLKAFLTLFSRNRRRYGGFIVHFGITVIGLGVIGSTVYQQETQQTLRIGQSFDFGGYTLVYDSMEDGQVASDRVMDIANLSLYRNATLLATLRPRLDHYPPSPGGQPMSMVIAGAHSTLENDFYVLLAGWSETSQAATFKIYINPLINLVWWGGLILIVGTVISVGPNETSKVRAQVRSHSLAPAGATPA